MNAHYANPSRARAAPSEMPAAQPAMVAHQARIFALLLPGFDLFDFAAICDVLGVTSGGPVGRVTVLGLAAGPVPSSARLPIPALGKEHFVNEPGSSLILFAGAATPRAEIWSAASWLLEQQPAQARFAGVSHGLVPFLEAGRLDGQTAVAPCDAIDSWRERYPRVRLEARLFELGGTVASAVGGASSIDFAASLIGARDGMTAAATVADRLNWSRVRGAHELQRTDDEFPEGSGALRSSCDLMRRCLEHPLSSSEIARRVGIHPRQLQRLFRSQMGTTPCQFYITLRLERARQLLQTTDLKIGEVARRTGFVSASHFTLRYRQAFGLGPKRDRFGPAAVRRPLPPAAISASGASLSAE